MLQRRMQALLTPENWVTELRDVQDARRQFPVIPNAPVPVFFPDPNRPDKTEEQCKQYVQGLFATQKPLWHLHADTDDRSRVWMGFASTNTRPDLISDSGYGYHVNHLAAFVDVDPLRTMLNPNATSHSRYIARAMLAITVCLPVLLTAAIVNTVIFQISHELMVSTTQFLCVHREVCFSSH